MWEILFSMPLFKAIRTFSTVPRIADFCLVTKEVLPLLVVTRGKMLMRIIRFYDSGSGHLHQES